MLLGCDLLVDPPRSRVTEPQLALVDEPRHQSTQAWVIEARPDEHPLKTRTERLLSVHL